MSKDIIVVKKNAANQKINNVLSTSDGGIINSP